MTCSTTPLSCHVEDLKVGQPWITNRAYSAHEYLISVWPQWCDWNSLAFCTFPWLQPESTRVCVLLMLPAALCSGLAALSCGWVDLWRNILQHIKKMALKTISSLLNVKVGYLCMQNLAEWGWMFVSVLERQRAILEDGYHHTVVWQRDCRKLTF